MSARERCDVLLDAYLDAQASPEELAELQGLLEADDDLWALAESRLGVDSALRALKSDATQTQSETFGRNLMERLTCEEDSAAFAGRVTERLQGMADVDDLDVEDVSSDAVPTKLDSTPATRKVAISTPSRGSRRRPLRKRTQLASTSRRRTSVKSNPWKVPLSLAAILAVMATVFMVVRGGPASRAMSIAALTGEVVITRAEGKRVKARPGSQVAAGDELTTTRGSTVTLAFSGNRKGTIELKPDSHVALKRIGAETVVSLDQGRLAAELHKQPTGYYLQFRTPHSVSTITGTAFTLSAQSDRSRLDVAEGSVIFKDLAQPTGISVTKGYYAVTGEDALPMAWLAKAPKPTAVHPPTPDTFSAGQVKGDGASMVYRLFTPPGYDKRYRYPLVVHLHGLGERGNDNQKQIANEANGAFAFISEARQKKDPAFFVAPQYPGGNHWLMDSHANNVHRIVKKLQATYSIDPDRIYIAGLSFGGFGVWEQLRRFDDTYAAALPVCGALQNVPVEGMTPGLINTPMWNWHGDNDPVVKPTVSINAVKRLRQAGGQVHFSLMKGKGHAIWREVYTNDRALDWMFAQRRGQAHVGKPYLEVTSTSTPLALEITQETVRISGVLHHDSQALPVMTYHLNGSKAGSIKAAKAWQFTSPQLSPGKHSVVIVATYPDGLSLSATLLITRQ